MSTKTLRKRIALIAASALTAGVLSVVAVPAANAAAGDGNFDTTTGTYGLVGAITPALGNPTNSTTRTAVMLRTGKLYLSTVGTAAVKVSAGAIINGATTIANVDANQACAVVAAGEHIQIAATGNAGTTFSVTGYDEDTCASAATVGDILTVTIASTSLAGVASAADSSVRWDSNSAGDAPSAADDITNSSTSTGNQLYLRINVADAYAQDISDTTGALVVTASSGAVLGSIGTSAGTAAGSTASTAVSSADPSALWVRVGEATAGAGWSGTVSVTYNGVLLATKSGKITGKAAKLVGTPYKIAKTGGATTTNAFLYTLTDTAGNGLATTAASIVMDSSSNSAVVSDANGYTAAAYGNTYGDYVGQGTYTCTSTAGTSSIVIKTVLSDATVIKSAPFTATCGGDAATYTASFDKASYVQGEVAKMTIVFRDSRGALANSETAVDTVTSGASNMTISAPMMAQVGSFTSVSKPGLAGTLEVNFTVGTSSGLTEGSYNAVVNIPNLNTLGKAQNVAYKVTTGTTTVSNAEVLKSIVSLIASINKQIQALQKLILKR
jgi:hypothetical protein